MVTETKPKKKKKKVKEGVYDNELRLAKKSYDVEISVMPLETELHVTPLWDELPRLSVSDYLQLTKANAFSRVDVWEPRKAHKERKLLLTDAKGQQAYVDVRTGTGNFLVDDIMKKYQ